MGYFYVGSLVGFLSTNGTISNSYSTGTVSGSISSQYIGGLVGVLSIGTIENSYSKVTVSGSSRVGGLVAYQDVGTISNSYSTGAVSGDNLISGLMGYQYGGTIRNSYSTSTVSGLVSSQYAGGLVGYQLADGIIENSYSTGAVTGDSEVGGLIGRSDGGTVSNCFWDTETSGKSSSAGGAGVTGLTTVEMKTKSTFTDAGWDFTTPIWKIGDGISLNSYPYLTDIDYDTPGATPKVNPIPGLEILCKTDIYVDENYDDNTSGWGETYFSDLDLAVTKVCDGGTIYLATESKFIYNGDLDFSNFKVELGDYDFELTGNITAGLIKTIGDGRLVMKDISANTTKTFPITDGKYNYTITITTADNSNPEISVRLTNSNTNNSLGAYFWDINGPTNLNATVTLRIDKAAIAPTKIQSNSQLRFYDTEKGRYVPVNGDNFTVTDMGSYYLMAITNMNKF